ERALVRHAAFDSLGHQLVDVFDVSLEIAVLGERPGLHRSERAHAAVFLETLALVDDHLTRRLVGPREQRADHHAVGARGDRLGDVAGVAYPSVRDHRNTLDGDRLRDVVHGRDLRHADARDDTRRARGAGT